MTYAVDATYLQEPPPPLLQERQQEEEKEEGEEHADDVRVRFHIISSVRI